MIINLALPSHDREAIQQVLTTTHTSRLCSMTHIAHPTLPLPFSQVDSLNRLIQANLEQNLTHLIIFHHLRITAMSALIPSDRTLTVTLNNTIHTLTPPRTVPVATPHHLHLYLNPHDQPPYLQHTYTGNEPAPYRLVVTPSLLTQRSASPQARRRPMMRTTSYAPDLVTTLTFPAESTQHQQSILTLVTHLLLTVPVITQRQSWNIIREKDSHRHTLQLILAIITLKRYHLVWHSVMTGTHTLQPQQQQTTATMTNNKRHTTPLPPRNPPTKRQRHAPI